MQDIKQFFSYMNDISFSYIVLRNWEGLPYQVELGSHSDLDLLVYDFDHWKEIYPKAIQVYPAPRVQFKVPVNGSFIQVDVRSIGDGYYPVSFEKLLLETRVYNPNGFFTPNLPLHRIALSYHACHHKNQNNYKKWLGDVSTEEILKALRESDVGWTKPSDPTVGRFNQYMKGATASIEKKDGKVIKKQTAYKEYDLIGNEARILAGCNSKHFPQIYRMGEDDIEIEDCGEELIVKNLPKDWKKQLIEIIKDLKEYKIEHRDIQPNNLMVKNEVIKLIDFGWSILKDDPKDNPPSCLGYPYRASWGPDDNFAMTKVIREFEYQEEENGIQSKG